MDFDSAESDRSIHDAQEQSACYVFSTWAQLAGHDRFVAALAAAYRGENPYADGSTTAATATRPITAKLLLDMVDERAMIPAGVTDLDKAQSLLTGTQVLTESDLQARSAARAKYHALLTTAGAWKLPPAIRDAMTAWKFTDATAAMNAASQILAFRDRAQKDVAELKLNGTTLQSGFEAAKTQADLDAVLALAKGEADAAAKVAEASRLERADRSIVQSIGLLGRDVSTPMSQARAALDAVKPADASASAQTVIDSINHAGDEGTVRAAAVIGVLLALLLLVAVRLVVRRRRRRAATALTVGQDALAQPNVFDPASMAGFMAAPPNSLEGTWTAPQPVEAAPAPPVAEAGPVEPAPPGQA